MHWDVGWWSEEPRLRHVHPLACTEASRSVLQAMTLNPSS